jgi:HAMP domain-containing protein
MALELGEREEAQRRLDAQPAARADRRAVGALFSTSGALLATATGELATLHARSRRTEQLRGRARSAAIAVIESSGDKDLLLRVLVAVMPAGSRQVETRILQLTQPVPGAGAQRRARADRSIATIRNCRWARGADAHLCHDADADRAAGAVSRPLPLAFVLARRLSAPLSILAEGTQAVAAGDFTPRQAIYSRDELGVLTQSFNQMTRQLDDARRDTERHRAELESARAYLESILANLSAGVLVFDRRFVLRTVNAGRADHSRGRLHRLARPAGRCLAARSRCSAGDPRVPLPSTAQANGRTQIELDHRAACRRFCSCAERNCPRDRTAAMSSSSTTSPTDRRAAQRRLGRSGAASGARDQEPADADPALGRATADEACRQALSGADAEMLDRRRRRSSPGAGDEAHGQRFQRLRAHAGARTGAARPQRPDRRGAGLYETSQRADQAHLAAELAAGLGRRHPVAADHPQSPAQRRGRAGRLGTMPPASRSPAARREWRSWWSPITARVFRPRSSRASSSPTSPPRRVAPAWAWRSSRRSSMSIMGASRSTTVSRSAPRSASACPWLRSRTNTDSRFQQRTPSEN